MAPPSLRTFGTAEARLGDTDDGTLNSVQLFALGKPLALLTFLHATGGAATREQLVDLLWADVPPESGRHTLRQTLWYLRKRLGGQPFATDGDIVRLVAPLSSDRVDFLRALDAGDAETAFQAYTGDFLPGFASPGAAAFEQWADLERQRLRTLFIGAAGRVVRTRLEVGRARDALAAARRARDLAPASQATWRMVLESLVAAGDLVGARAEAERLTAELAADEFEPEPATQQLLRIVHNGRPVSTTPPDPRAIATELVGRDVPFARLLEAYERAAAGHPQHVHVSAPAGLGKTRLLEGLAARLRSQRGTRPRLIATRATPAERSMPYAFAGQLVTAMVGLRGAAAVSPDSAATLLALAPAASTFLSGTPDHSTGDDALRRRTLALSELIAAVSDDAPLALLVDDVHWMDSPSRTVLAAVAERLEHGRVLLVTTGRGADAFADLVPRAVRLPLTPLTIDDVLALVGSVAMLPAEPWAELFPTRLQVATGGSPLLIIETLQLALEREHLTVDGSTWRCDDPSALLVLLGTGHALQQRLGALPATARDVLLALSIAGEPLNDDTLRRVLGVEVVDATTLLDARGLATRFGDTWRPAHDEIGALAVELATPRERVAMHTALAEWLETQPLAPRSFNLSRALWHRWRAGDAPALDAATRRFIEQGSATGDGAPPAERLREALGAEVSSEALQAVVDRLPWRLRRTSPSRLPLFAAAALLVAATSMVVRKPAAPSDSPPDVTLVARMQGSGSEGHWVRASMSLDDFASHTPLDVEATLAPIAEQVLDSVATVVAIPRRGDFVAFRFRADRPDLAIDLMRITADGTMEPLVSRQRDQSGQRPSPDGRQLAFIDRGFWPSQTGEVMLLDLETRRETRLTTTPTHEALLVWAPDGQTLAFTREFADSSGLQLCLVSLRTQNERCHPFPESHIPVDHVVWRLDNQLVMAAISRRTGLTTLVRWTPGAPEVVEIDEGARSYLPDPTGQVVVCECALPGYDGVRVSVFSVDEPLKKRPLRFEGRTLERVDVAVQLWQSFERPPTTVRVLAPDTVVIGDAIQLAAVGRDARGREIALPRRRWTVLDSTVATITEGGVLRPLAVGTVRVVLGTSERLVDTAYIVSQRPTERIIVADRFTEPIEARWFKLGVPSPYTVRDFNGTVLRLNGDEVLQSGVVSRRAIHAQNGAGLRVRFRAPIVRPVWQSLHLALDATASDSQLQWLSDHPDEALPASWSWRVTRGCSMDMPRGEGTKFRNILGLNAGGRTVATAQVPPAFGDGAVHEAIIQLNADGRCSFTLDGVLLGTSDHAIPLDRPHRALLLGQSVGTIVEILEVELWQGLRLRGATRERTP